MTPESLPSVTEFFESYRAAFEAMNAPEIAGFFVFPLHVTSEADEISLICVDTRPDWIRQIEHLLAMYRVIGVTSAKILELSMDGISPHLFEATIHWALYDAAGAILYDFTAMYTLAQIEHTLHITAICHDEIPHYQECLANLEAQRRSGGGSG